VYPISEVAETPMRVVKKELFPLASNVISPATPVLIVTLAFELTVKEPGDPVPATPVGVKNRSIESVPKEVSDNE